MRTPKKKLDIGIKVLWMVMTYQKKRCRKKIVIVVVVDGEDANRKKKLEIGEKMPWMVRR